MNILDEITEKRRKSIGDIIKKYEKANRIPKKANLFYNSILSHDGYSIISEVKFASPSMGDIKEKTPIKNIIQDMEKGGIVGLSVLTEPDYFKGSPEYIKEIRKYTKLPILMKDFFIHESQIHFAADLDANMILIIAAILKREEISKFLEISKRLGLDSLIEIHDEKDLERIKGLDVKIIGINNRNLTDFSIDLNTTKKLIPLIKNSFPNSLIISESGIKTREDMNIVFKAGANATLIGTTIMQSDDIRAKIKELKGEI